MEAFAKENYFHESFRHVVDILLNYTWYRLYPLTLNE